MGLVQPGASLTIRRGTYDPATGESKNADSTPTAQMFRNGTLDGTVAFVVSNVGTGRYSYAFTIPAGYAIGDLVEVIATATVDGRTASATVYSEVLSTAGDIVSVLGTALSETTAGNLATNLSVFWDNENAVLSPGDAKAGNLDLAVTGVAAAVLSGTGLRGTAVTLEQTVERIFATTAGRSTGADGAGADESFFGLDNVTAVVVTSFDPNANRTPTYA